MRIRYRPTFLQGWLPSFAALFTAYAFVALLACRQGTPLFPSEQRGMIISVIVVPFLCSLFLGNVGVTVTPEVLVIRNGTTKRTVHRSEIQGIVVVSVLGFRWIEVTRIDGRRIGLRAPQSFLDRDFDRKVQVIRECWLGTYDWSSASNALLR